MPTKPKRPCPGSPRCPHFAGACPVHPVQPRSGWVARPSSAAGQRTRGEAWMVIRRRVLAEEHACAVCGRPGDSGDMVDHVTPIIDRGTSDRANLRRLCRGCHAMKTGRESVRGRR